MPTKVYRNVFVSPLIEESDSKDNIVLDAVLHNSDLYTSIQKQYLQGITTSANKLYAYAEDGYKYGLPVASLSGNSSTSDSDITDILSGIEGEDVTLDSTLVENPDEIFLATEILLNNYSYDLATNVVSNPPFTPPAGSTVTFADADFDTGVIDISYSVQESDILIPPTITTVSEPITNLNIEDIYYMVIYATDAAPADLLYWSYNSSLGTYPDLDVVDIPLDINAYYPVIPLRINKHTLEPADGEDYTTTVAALDILDLDFEDIMEGVEENPEIDAIEDVSVQFALDLSSEESNVHNYLWKYFKALGSYNKLSTFTNRGTKYLNGLTTYVKSTNYYYKHTVTILEEKIFPGTFTKSKENFTGNYASLPNGVYEGLSIPTRGAFVLRKQVTPTSYSELIVGSFSMTYFAGSSNTSTNRNRAVNGNTYDIGSEFERPLHIPVNLQILKAFTNNPKDRSELLRASLTITINTRDVVDIAWYETDTFIAFVISLSIVISIVTLQPEIAALAAAASIYAATQIALTILIDYYLMQLIVKYSLEFLVKEFGLENTAIAIAAMIAISLATGESGFISLPSLPFADEMLRMSSALLNGMSAPINDAFNELKDDTVEFLKSAAERQEEIEEANSLLGTNNIDFFNLVTKPNMLGVNESPTDYYNRTIHNTNPGVMSLDVIGTYVSNVIRLPEPNESLI